MNKWIQRKLRIQVNRRSQKDIPFQADPVNLIIRVRERIPETKAAKGIYHLPVEEKVMIVAAVMRNRTKENYGTPNPAEKFLSLKKILCKSKMRIKKG